MLEMGKVSLFGRMEMFMSESGRIIIRMEKVFILVRMAMFIRGSGRMIK